MSLFSRLNPILPVALGVLLGCASKPPPAPRPPPEEEAFVLDSKDPTAAPPTNGKSKKKKDQGASGDSASTASHDVGPSLGSSPDHFGSYRLGASQSSFQGQDFVKSSDGRSSISSGDSTYHGIALSTLTFQFKGKALELIYFAANGSSNCKRMHVALERDYGTALSSDQKYTTDKPRYLWTSATAVLDFEIDPDSCSGSVYARLQGATDER